MEDTLKRFDLQMFASLTEASIGVTEGSQGAITTAVTTGPLPTGSTANRLTPLIMQVYSREILFQAQPQLRFDQFATIRTELGIQPGLTITLTRFNNLVRGGALTEGVRMVAQSLNGNQVQLTVTEMGNAVSISELLLRSAFDNIMAVASTLLGFDVAIVLDAQLMAVTVSGTNVQYAGRALSRATTTAAFGTQLVKDMREVLATNNAQKIDDSYVCFVHPHQGREIRDDANWITASEYGSAGQIFRGEIGMYEDVRFIETTVMPVIQNAGLGGAPVYQSCMFGFNAYGLAVALPVELRDNGVIDFQRERELGYYGIWGVGSVTDANLVRGESI